MSDERDFLAEMRAICQEAIDSTEQPNPMVARDVVDKLRANDPELLTGWLLARAATTVCDYLTMMDHSQRAHSRQVGPGRAFADAAARFEAGEADALAMFEGRYVIDEKGTRRRVADMTGPDHLFVAGQYGESARTARFLESVHRAVAKKCGARRTSEVYTPEAYAAMFAEPTKPAGRKAAAA